MRNNLVWDRTHTQKVKRKNLVSEQVRSDYILNSIVKCNNFFMITSVKTRSDQMNEIERNVAYESRSMSDDAMKQNARKYFYK